MSYNKSFEALVVEDDNLLEDVQEGDALVYSIEEQNGNYKLQGLGVAKRESVALGEKKGEFVSTYDGHKWDENGALDEIGESTSGEVYSLESLDVEGAIGTTLQSAVESIENEYNEGKLGSKDEEKKPALDANIPQIGKPAD